MQGTPFFSNYYTITLQWAYSIVERFSICHILCYESINQNLKYLVRALGHFSKLSRTSDNYLMKLKNDSIRKLMSSPRSRRIFADLPAMIPLRMRKLLQCFSNTGENSLIIVTFDPMVDLMDLLIDLMEISGFRVCLQDYRSF